MSSHSLPHANGPAHDPFAGPVLERVLPLTAAQREVWLATQLGPEASLAFNEPYRVDFSGALDVAALQAALDALVARHESLRATVTPDGASLAVHEAGNCPIAFEDLQGLGDEDCERQLAARAESEVSVPFDLGEGPLLRARLLRTAADRHVLLLTIHHIVCDGWSFGVVMQDLAALYRTGSGTSETLPPAERFSSYVAREAARVASAEAEADERFWLNEFADGVPILELPTDRPRPVQRRRDSARATLRIPGELASRVPALASAANSSVFGVLCTAFAECLGRVASTDDVIVGVPAAGQAAAGMPRLVGHCVNLLPLRLARDDTRSPVDAVRATQERLFDAFEHQEYTYGTLLTRLLLPRDASRPPLVNVMFNLDQRLPSGSLGFEGIDVQVATLPRRYETFELFVSVLPDNEGFGIECQYATALFDAETVALWLDAFVEQLRVMVERPQEALRVLPLVPATQRAQVDGWNATGSGTAGVVSAMIEAQALRSPQAIAVRDDLGAWDYETLWSEVRQLAAALQRAGVVPGDRVGVSLRRGRGLVQAPLAVMLTGAAYVPLDPSNPSARLATMARDAGVRIVIRDEGGGDAWLAGLEVVVLQASKEAGTQFVPPSTAPEDMAYVIFTSGSTGEPKGVAVSHGALANVLSSLAQTPGISAGDRLVAVTTLAFDIASVELFLPLMVGAEVVIAGADDVVDASRLLALVQRSAATVMQATPSTYRLLVSAGLGRVPSLRAWVGGEALPSDLAESLCSSVGEVWNLYGPTETTVWSSCWRVQNPSAGVRIGTPIAGTRIEVRDAHGRDCGVAIPGEIVIGGVGVAIGYWNRPELTAAVFSTDADGVRWYRTGDRGRWRSDGTLEHLGRIDLQIKLRGHRIEPGEIEVALRSHASVADTVVLTHAVATDDVRLVAYIVPKRDGAFKADELAQHLRQRLPDYMLPQHFVPIDSVPRLPSGKLDRRGLPSPTAVSSTATTAEGEPPLGEREQLVAEEMEAVLRLPGLRRDDDFFAMGGHSLLAAMLASRLGRRIGRPVPLAAVLAHPTLRGLAEWSLTPPRTTNDQQVLLRARHWERPAPVSFAQHRLLFVEQLNPEGALYNTPSGHRLHGSLDVDAFTLAFADVVARQPSLRTTFERDATGEMRQRVLSPEAVRLGALVDLSDLPADQREAALLQALSDRSQEPFALFGGPLARAALFRIEPEVHVLFLMLHHAIWDGWSFDVFYREIDACYTARLAGHSPDLPALPVTYADFAAWQREALTPERLRPQLEYWTSRLRGALEPIELPADFPRPAVQSGRADTLWFDLPRETADRVRELARNIGATPFELLLAVFSVFVARLSGREAMVIGVPERGRAAPELENVMGLFVSFLPVRVDVMPDQRFVDLLRQVRASARAGLAHPDVPFEHLVRELALPRDGRMAPVFQVVFSYQDGRTRPQRWGNVRHEPNFVRRERIAEDLTVSFVEREDGLRGAITYNSDIIGPASAIRMRARFSALLMRALAEPEMSITALGDPDADEVALEESWNATASAVSGLVHSLVLEQAERTPGAPAIHDADGTWTYGELRGAAQRLAGALRARGVKPGDRVAVLLPRGRAVVQAQLAVMLVGAAYVPLDLSHPSARLRYLLDDARPRLVVVDRSHLPEMVGAHATLEVGGIATDSAPDAVSEPALQRPEDPAYLIYTSGSTGNPKGVVVSHAAVANFLASMRESPGITVGDRVLSITTPAFDISVLELLLPLSVGASVIVASAEQVGDGHALGELIERQEITVFQGTPSTYRLLLAAGWTGKRGLKALVGGEPLNRDLAQALVPRVGELWNMYGPTESTVWSTCWRVPANPDAIRIGRPIRGTKVQVWDGKHRRCPIGVPGEIVIGGAGLADGYWDRPALTAEQFVRDDEGMRWYLTGDRGRWCEDGNLEHLGRQDRQIKLRGFRIEPAEVEGALRRHPDVRDAVVITHQTAGDDARLVAYVVPHVERRPTGTALRAHVRANLPPYMVPGVFVLLERVPRLASGKLDLRSLPNPFASAAPEAQQRVAPRTETERTVADVWRQVLGVDDVSIHDTFLDLGGHSLLSLQAAARLEASTGKKVRLRTFFTQTLAQMAATLDELPSAQSGSGGHK